MSIITGVGTSHFRFNLDQIDMIAAPAANNLALTTAVNNDGPFDSVVTSNDWLSSALRNVRSGMDTALDKGWIYHDGEFDFGATNVLGTVTAGATAAKLMAFAAGTALGGLAASGWKWATS